MIVFLVKKLEIEKKQAHYYCYICFESSYNISGLVFSISNFVIDTIS